MSMVRTSFSATLLSARAIYATDMQSIAIEQIYLHTGDVAFSTRCISHCLGRHVEHFIRVGQPATDSSIDTAKWFSARQSSLRMLQRRSGSLCSTALIAAAHFSTSARCTCSLQLRYLLVQQIYLCFCPLIRLV